MILSIDPTHGVKLIKQFFVISHISEHKIFVVLLYDPLRDFFFSR